MQLDKIDDFLYKPLWQQQLMLTIVMVILWVVGYFILLWPINNEQDYQRTLYRERQSIIEQLQQKLSLYPKYFDLQQLRDSLNNNPLLLKQKFSNKESAEKIALLILTSRLTLRKFQSIAIEDNQLWNIELEGAYADFVDFIWQSKQEEGYFDFSNIVISQNNLGIIFSLSITNYVVITPVTAD